MVTEMSSIKTLSDVGTIESHCQAPELEVMGGLTNPHPV